MQHRFFADAGITADRRDLIIKVDNASNVAVPAHIHLRGPVKFAGSATVFTLHTPNPSLDNDFRHPDRIVPQRSIISAAGALLHYRFKAYSITVLRLRIKP